MRDTLTQLVQQLLDTEDFKQGEAIGTEIFQLLSEEFGLDREKHWDNIRTAHTQALNAWDSGRCVMYPVRVRKTMQAIIKRLQNDSGNILYVGPGPFAPYFLFPLLLGYSGQFTLLEINPFAVNILKEMIQYFGLDAQVISVVQADATLWTIDRPYHTILVETSDVGIRREDTIPIYKNISQQLPQATFQPKDIHLLAGTGVTRKTLPEPFDSLWQAVARGGLRADHPYPPEEQPFVQNRILLDDEIVIEPDESIVTKPLYLSPSVLKEPHNIKTI